MNNQPAFPAPSGVAHITDQGMTLRDYFAAKALQVFYKDLVGDESTHPDSVAYWCYLMADAMLKAREA
jgi:hypothetical protein